MTVENRSIALIETCFKRSVAPGIDRGHISEVEHGKKNVCLPMLDVLANGFGISISALMRDT